MTVEDPQPRFRQLAALLRRAIEAGEYPPGSALPSESELAARHSVDRRTVNDAVRILRAEGLVRTEHGRGTFVRRIPVIHRQAPGRYAQENRERAEARGAFDGEIRALGMTPRTEVDVRTGPAPADVAAALGLTEGEQAVMRIRRMFADDEPVQLATSYIPASIAAGTQIAEVDSGPGGIISRFAELGHAQTRITETVRWRPPQDQEAAFLRLDAGQAVAEIWHTGWTAGGRAVEVCVHVVPAHLWALSYEWPLG